MKPGRYTCRSWQSHWVEAYRGWADHAGLEPSVKSTVPRGSVGLTRLQQCFPKSESTASWDNPWRFWFPDPGTVCETSCYRRSLENTVLSRTLIPHTSLFLKVWPWTSIVTWRFIRNACSWAHPGLPNLKFQVGPVVGVLTSSAAISKTMALGRFQNSSIV